MSSFTKFGVEKIDLFLSANDLKQMQTFSQSDPFAVVFIKNGPDTDFIRIGTTPVIKDNVNPSWSTPIQTDYLFEVDQDVLIKVYQWDGKESLDNLAKHQLIGQTQFLLSSVIRSPAQKLSLDITDEKHKTTGKFHIHSEQIVNSRDLFCVTFSGVKLANKDGFFGTSDPFLVISRMSEDGNYTVVFKSNKIDNTLNPKWREVKIPMTQLCNNDLYRPLKIEIMDWDSNGKHDSMGIVETTANGLLQANGSPIPVIEEEKKKKKKSYTNSGHLIASHVTVEHHPTFTQYLAGGLDLSMIVAIDFTGSNGEPSVPASLHYIDTASSTLMNPYQRTIQSVGTILEHYDKDKKYPVYGFGARVRTPNGDLSAVQHCFPVYGGGYEVEGVNGILQAYKDCVTNVTFSGPTLFNPLIDAAKNIAVSKQCSQTNQVYTILLIITDGVINDMSSTKQAIAQASELPLSIIIVGVGNADFKGMEELDGDKHKIENSKRDIVQFVQFKDQHSAVLAQQVLGEIPTQVLEYLESNQIKPN